MTRAQAEKEAKKRWGAKALIRANEQLSSKEKREQQIARNGELRIRRDAIQKEITERLNALDWYTALIRERTNISKELSASQWNSHYYKFAVGMNLGYAFHVNGEGDTWEDAFARADEKAKVG